MTEKTEKCAHQNCSCPANADTGYCSDFCVHANDNMDTKTNCGCGHPHCATQAKTPPLNATQIA